MKMNTDIFKRRSIRLKGWDYRSSGLYFVTVCTQNRACQFGKINNNEMELNEAGHVVDRCWQGIPKHFPHAELDEFVVMPNHVHGIIAIFGSIEAYNHTPNEIELATQIGAKYFSHLPDGPSIHSPSKTIGSMVRGFKIGVSEWFHKNTDNSIVWQRNYYDHIIRNEAELNQTRQYILDNPSTWLEDDENPERKIL